MANQISVLTDFENLRVNVQKNSPLVLFLLTIFAFSATLNTISLKAFFRIKKKISPDHIRAHIFLINLLFTFTAIPYYLLKELEILKSEAICKLLYFLTDFIMFTYNNLLILMALDRFLFICTQVRYRADTLMRRFYFASTLISSLALVRLFTNTCDNVGFKNFALLFKMGEIDNQTLTESNTTVVFWKMTHIEMWSMREHMLIAYNYTILFVMGTHWLATFVLYSIIVKYVYQNTLNQKMYAFRQSQQFGLIGKMFSSRKKTLDPDDNLDGTILDSSKSATDGKEVLYEDSNVTSSVASATQTNLMDLKMENRKRIKNLTLVTFKKSKHWTITKTFIKVKLQFF
jgi:hypothetical protein